MLTAAEPVLADVASAEPWADRAMILVEGDGLAVETAIRPK